MRPLGVLGFVFVAVGTLVLAFRSVTYLRERDAVHVVVASPGSTPGDQSPADSTQTMRESAEMLTPAVGIVCLAVGLILVIAGSAGSVGERRATHL